MDGTGAVHLHAELWKKCGEDISGYTRGIIVQTKGELEDEFDGEGMMETEALHKEHFVEMHDQTEKRISQSFFLLEPDAVPDAPNAAIQMHRAVFRRNVFLQWRHTECW